MKHIVTAVAAAALLFGTAGAGVAKSAKAGGKAHIGTSAKLYAPGQRAKVAGAAGAKAYAPGQRMKASGTIGGRGGASVYAPGQMKSTTGAGVRVR